MNQLFTGLRILDLTKVFSGPFATRQFADYGAEVIKIENSDNPDDSRAFPPLKNNWSGYFEILNRNKKGITLNLTNEDDLQKFYKLCETSDCVVENLTPSTKHKLKIDYTTIYNINPRIIYASLSGLGQNSNRKYYDVIAQAESGLMSLTGTENNPMKIGPAVVDAFSGMTLAFAISSALFYREKTGMGQYVDVSMIGSAMNLLESNLIEYSITKENPKRTGNHDNLIAPFGVYKVKDGSIVIAIGNDSLWQKFEVYLNEHVSSFKRSLFISNHLRLKNHLQLVQLVEQALSHYSMTESIELLSQLGIPCSKVAEMSDVYSNELFYTSEILEKKTHSTIGTYVTPK
jgi:CoA:oxalate CoA-transferase